MSSAVVPSALVLAGVNAAAALLGAALWWRHANARAFWPLLRLGQALAVLFAVYVGVLAAAGHRPQQGLFWLYALLPLAVGLIAEQLRLVSARTVLDQRGLEDAQAMRALPAEEQHEIVHAIVRRELGVMVCAAAVVVFLALRAAQVGSGF